MTRRLFTSLAVLLLPVVLVIAITAFFVQAQTTSNQTAKAADKQPAQVPQAANGTWSDIAPFPSVTVSPTPGTQPLKLKRAAAAAYPANGKVYVFGGRHGADGEDFPINWIWEYTPGTPGTWAHKNAVIDTGNTGNLYVSNVVAATLTDATGTHIYLVGGSTINSVESGEVRMYDPTTDTVTPLGGDAWPASPARVPGGYAVYNNKLYVFGGYSAQNTSAVYNDTWVFDPLAPTGSKWSQLAATLSVGRAYMAGAGLDGYIYAIGGETISGEIALTVTNMSTVERLNVTVPNPSWQPVASLPTARGDLRAWAYDSGTGYEISGKILVGGGTYPTPDNQTYLYDPATNSWSTYGTMTHATRNFASAELNGILYAFGGYDFSANLPDGANFAQAYDGSVGATFTPTASRTATRTSTSTSTNTPIPPATNTATSTVVPSSTVTETPVPSDTPAATETPMPTACIITFSDVPPGSQWYSYVECMACQGIISGYSDGTFRPEAFITRGQIAKIVALAAGFNDPQTIQMFADVPVGSTFFEYIGRLASRGYMGGYPCGVRPGELCGAESLPYFRPYNNSTRGQIAKIDANAAGYNETPTGQQFEDVPPGSTFYDYAYRIALHNIMSGYPCGGPSEPCGPGGLPYFRTNSSATRGQTSKIVANTFLPDCAVQHR